MVESTASKREFQDDVETHAPFADHSSSSATPSEHDDNLAVYHAAAAAAAADETVDPREAARVLRKIDAHLIPVLFLTYLLQYLDKNAINYASVYGLQEGTKLHGSEYSWLSSLFYFGYLIAQYPAGYLMQRLPIGRFMTGVTGVWGIIVITTPACHDFAGIAINRFFLGFVEAAVNPGFVLIVGMWYTAAEQPLRLEAYYCTNGIATMFGGLIGYAVGHIDSGLPRWMYVFLIFGACSLAAAVFAFFMLPDLPSTARFLTERERIVAVERVAGNRQGVKNRHFKKYQVVQTLYDPKTWILFVMAVGAQIPNAALTSFTSLIIQSFGFKTLGTQYLQIPGGAVNFLTLIGANTICILGSALLVGLPQSNKWGRLVAIWLCYFQGLGFSMSLTMVSSNVAGYTKKQLTGAILFTGYCVGNIIGPQTFKSNESPGYHSAYIAMLVGYCVKLLMVVVLYSYMWSVNKQRDREAAAGGMASDDEAKAAIEQGMHDATELDNKGFRYVL